MAEDITIQWLGIIISALTLLIAVFAGIWAYARFVLERSLLPSVQPDLICNVPGTQDNKKIIEILLHLKNIGPSTFVVKHIHVDIHYINRDDKELRLFGEPDPQIGGKKKEETKLGLMKFPHVLRKELAVQEPKEESDKPESKEGSIKPEQKVDSIKSGSKEGSVKPEQKGKQKVMAKCKDKFRGFPILKDSIFFVQPGVDQIFTFVTGLPVAASYVLVHVEFCYVQNMTPWKKLLLKISKALGLVQFTLENVTYPHTLERVFNIARNEGAD